MALPAHGACILAHGFTMVDATCIPSLRLAMEALVLLQVGEA